MSLYVVRQKVDKSKEEEKVRYHGVPVSSGQISIDELAKDISGRCSLHESDVHAAVIALGDVMQTYLMKGNTVHLKNIGMFSISAGSEGFETPDECTPSKVTAQRVCFKADKEMRSILPEIKYQRTYRETAKK